jgi:hypothetical protein
VGFTIFGFQFGSSEPDYPSPIRCADPRPQYGLPLTIAEAGRLADSLALVDRTSRTVLGGHNPGMPWVRSLANQVAGYVGGAKILGYVYVPFPLSSLGTVDRALEAGMGMQEANIDLSVFEALVQRMHVLAGMATMAGWTLDPDADGVAWIDEPSRDALGHGEGDEVAVIA